MAKTILVVDDEADVVQGLAAVLEAEGFKVVTARDGQEALAKVRSERPDLLILDLVLPKLDGWRVCQQLKLSKEFHKIPVILLSGLLMESSGKDELSLGDALLPKPCPPGQLLATLRSLLALPPAAPGRATHPPGGSPDDATRTGTTHPA